MKKIPALPDLLWEKLPFIVYGCGLLLLYVWNVHQTTKLLITLEKERIYLKQIKWEYLTSLAQYTSLMRESTLKELAQRVGLQPLSHPPVHIDPHKR